MFVVWREIIENTSSKRLNKQAIIQVLDLDDFVLEGVTIEQLLSSIKNLGVEQFYNVEKIRNSGYKIEYINSLRYMSFDSEFWSFNKTSDALRFMTTPVRVWQDNNTAYLSINNNTYKLFKSTSSSKTKSEYYEGVFYYILAVPEAKNIFLVYYTLGVLELELLIDKSGRVLGVSSNKVKGITSYLCDKSLARLATKLSVIKDCEGWWSRLLQLKG